MDLRDRNVVVTGASGALGGAVTALLLEQGATCHLPVRRTIEPSGFGAANRGRVSVTSGVDLTDEGAVRHFYSSLRDLWASVHCAGGFAMGPLAETSLGDLSGMLAINLHSAFLCCREAARVIRAGGGHGRIVNVAARPALEPRTGAGMTAYTASKAALAGLTVAFAEELAGEGIWVNAVAPSILDTRANRKAMPDADASRWPTVEDVARVIVFLASPANGCARGAIVPVYGRS